tara:strand:- start:830 stop:1222 length:393 start_codon:yes stop_codon:yes gene_type:complete
MENLSNISEIIGSLLKIDEEIKTFSEKQKILRKKRDLLEEMVLKTLNENKLTEKKFILNNNTIYCTKSNTLPPLNTNLIETILSRYINEKQVNFILKQIDDYRQNNRKDNIILKRKQIKNKSLKRIKSRV